MNSFCPNCGEPILASDAFCGDCGEPLTTEARNRRSDRAGEQRDSHWDESGELEGAKPEAGRTRERYGESGVRPPRKNAIETVTESFSWLRTVPVLIGAFVVVEFINTIGEFSFLFSIIGILLGLILWGVTYTYAERLVRGDLLAGDFDEFRETASSVSGSLLSLIGILIIYSVVVFVGLILFILPGVYLGARLILSFPACVLDDQRAFESLSTSWNVAQGNILKLIGIFLIWFAAVFGIGIVLAVLNLGDSFVVLLVAAPLFAILTGTIQFSIARVYLENRYDDPPRNSPSHREDSQYSGAD